MLESCLKPIKCHRICCFIGYECKEFRKGQAHRLGGQTSSYTPRQTHRAKE